MGYSNYKRLEQVTTKFGLLAKRRLIFDNTPRVEPSDWLKETLELAKPVPLQNEKVKSERIVSPILMDVFQHYQDKISFFSGEELAIDAEQDLSGDCYLFFTLVPDSEYLEAPTISITEAKDEDMDYGIAQCAAQLYGAKLFNERGDKTIPFLYGCATDGIQWRFIRFEDDTFYLNKKIYTDLREILGIWYFILNQYTTNT